MQVGGIKRSRSAKTAEAPSDDEAESRRGQTGSSTTTRLGRIIKARRSYDSSVESVSSGEDSAEDTRTTKGAGNGRRTAQGGKSSHKGSIKHVASISKGGPEEDDGGSDTPSDMFEGSIPASEDDAGASVDSTRSDADRTSPTAGFGLRKKKKTASVRQKSSNAERTSKSGKSDRTGPPETKKPRKKEAKASTGTDRTRWRPLELKALAQLTEEDHVRRTFEKESTIDAFDYLAYMHNKSPVSKKHNFSRTGNAIKSVLMRLRRGKLHVHKSGDVDDPSVWEEPLKIFADEIMGGDINDSGDAEAVVPPYETVMSRPRAQQTRKTTLSSAPKAGPGIPNTEVIHVNDKSYIYAPGGAVPLNQFIGMLNGGDNLLGGNLFKVVHIAGQTYLERPKATTDDATLRTYSFAIDGVVYAAAADPGPEADTASTTMPGCEHKIPCIHLNGVWYVAVRTVGMDDGDAHVDLTLERSDRSASEKLPPTADGGASTKDHTFVNIRGPPSQKRGSDYLTNSGGVTQVSKKLRANLAQLSSAVEAIKADHPRVSTSTTQRALSTPTASPPSSRAHISPAETSPAVSPHTPTAGSAALQPLPPGPHTSQIVVPPSAPVTLPSDVLSSLVSVLHQLTGGSAGTR